MKYVLSGIVLGAMCVLLPLSGCSKRTVPNFVRAEVTIRFPTDANLELGTKVVTDAEKVKRLAAFFPGVGEGRSSSMAGGWTADGTIEFFPSNGKSISVAFDSCFEYWSEYPQGDGDWPLADEFRSYLVELMKERDNRP